MLNPDILTRGDILEVTEPFAINSPVYHELLGRCIYPVKTRFMVDVVFRTFMHAYLILDNNIISQSVGIPYSRKHCLQKIT